MSREIPESDWKILRQLKDAALDRFCAQVLAELGQVAFKVEKSHHARYLEIYRLIQEKDERLAGTFNNLRRSSAFFQAAKMYAYGLLTEEEFQRFSAGTREAIELLSGKRSTSSTKG